MQTEDGLVFISIQGSMNQASVEGNLGNILSLQKGQIIKLIQELLQTDGHVESNGRSFATLRCIRVQNDIICDAATESKWPSACVEGNEDALT
jgi:hypothetical protein